MIHDDGGAGAPTQRLLIWSFHATQTSDDFRCRSRARVDVKESDSRTPGCPVRESTLPPQGYKEADGSWVL